MNAYRKARVIGGLLLYAGLILSPAIAASTDYVENPGAPTIPDAATIATALSQCPKWTRISPTDIAQREQITKIYMDLAHYPTDAIRAGVALYLESYALQSPYVYLANQKVFACLRVVFAVPATIDITGLRSPTLYTVWGNPRSGNTLDLLWPFSTDGSGTLVLSGADAPFHSGPMPDEIADFHVMEMNLERRFPPTK
jgi:hypothetical protein